VSGTQPVRDPRRSLITGTIIAGVVLAILALVVLIGIVIVFMPRRAGRDSLGPSPSVSSAALLPVPSAPAIHLIAPLSS
jgi:hypothetical protein